MWLNPALSNLHAQLNFFNSNKGHKQIQNNGDNNKEKIVNLLEFWWGKKWQGYMSSLRSLIVKGSRQMEWKLKRVSDELKKKKNN